MRLNNIINKIKQINPEIKFIGSFDENNQRTGYWEQYWFNSELNRRGNYINGLRDGYWEEYYHGKLLRKGKYINGKFYEIK